MTKDPEMRATTNGHEVCNFTVAVNRKGGNGSDDADFFRVSAWDKLAKVCKDYLTKGRKVCVVGPVGIRTYQTQKGDTRADLEVRAEDVEFLSAREKDAQTGYTVVQTDQLPFV